MVMQKHSTHASESGFTLIELLIVIATAVALSTISLVFAFAVSLANAQERSLSSDQIIDPCSMPNHSLHLNENGSVYYNSSTPVAGFQFNVDGATVVSATGGHAEAAGFTLPTRGNTVLGFSLDGATISGCGTMISLKLNGEATGISDIIISDANGEAILLDR